MSNQPEIAGITDVPQWIADLPKLELHVHLEGSMSVGTVSALTDLHRVGPTGVWPDDLATTLAGMPQDR